MTEGTREWEIPSRTNVGSWPDASPTKLGGEPIFRQGAVQQASRWRGLASGGCRFEQTPYQEAFGSLGLSWVVWRGAVFWPLSLFCFFLVFEGNGVL